MSQKRPPVKRNRLSQDPARLAHARIAAGLTLREAAAKAGCAFTHLSGLENGHHSARTSTLTALARAYECEIRDLMPLVATAAGPTRQNRRQTPAKATLRPDEN